MSEPQHHDAMLLLADVYLEQAQNDKARVLLDGLAVLWPGDADVLKALAYACLHCGRAHEALAAADAFIQLGPLTPANAPILLIRSRALWGLERVDEARAGVQHFFDLQGNA